MSEVGAWLLARFDALVADPPHRGFPGTWDNTVYPGFTPEGAVEKPVPEPVGQLTLDLDTD